MAAKDAPSTAGKTTEQEVSLPGLEMNLELSSLSAHIAAELAAGLSDADTIIERYNLSKKQWATLSKSPVFRAMLTEAIKTFRGDMNAGNRITKKAEIVLEDAIPAYDRIIHNTEVPPAARIEAGKLLAQLAGRTGKESGEKGVNGGFTLNLNLGFGKEKIVIEGSATPVKKLDSPND
jgi:hypothetical protein